MTAQAPGGPSAATGPFTVNGGASTTIPPPPGVRFGTVVLQNNSPLSLLVGQSRGPRWLAPFTQDVFVVDPTNPPISVSAPSQSGTGTVTATWDVIGPGPGRSFPAGIASTTVQGIAGGTPVLTSGEMDALGSVLVPAGAGQLNQVTMPVALRDYQTIMVIADGAAFVAPVIQPGPGFPRLAALSFGRTLAKGTVFGTATKDFFAYMGGEYFPRPVKAGTTADFIVVPLTAGLAVNVYFYGCTGAIEGRWKTSRPDGRPEPIGQNAAVVNPTSVAVVTLVAAPPAGISIMLQSLGMSTNAAAAGQQLRVVGTVNSIRQEIGACLTGANTSSSVEKNWPHGLLLDAGTDLEVASDVAGANSWVTTTYDLVA